MSMVNSQLKEDKENFSNFNVTLSHQISLKGLKNSTNSSQKILRDNSDSQSNSRKFSDLRCSNDKLNMIFQSQNSVSDFLKKACLKSSS